MKQANGHDIVEEAVEHSERWHQLRKLPETIGWSDEDVGWLAVQPPELANIAMRYGRGLFEVVMFSGGTSFGLGVLMQVCQRKLPVGQGMQALAVIQGQLNKLCSLAVLGVGGDESTFIKCREDIKQMVSLMVAEAPKAGPSGRIVLPS